MGTSPEEICFKKVMKEETEQEHKNKMFIPSSFQNFRDRLDNRGISMLPPRPGYSGSGRGLHMSYGQQAN